MAWFCPEFNEAKDRRCWLLDDHEGPCDFPPTSEDQPHYEFTCDAGNCDRETVAIVLTADDGWLSMCRLHAAEALGATARAYSVARRLLDSQCCDSHSPTCEYPGEICCWECTEIHHGLHSCDGWMQESHHDGSRCVLDA